MFKVRNLKENEKKEVDTEFWLEEDALDKCILLKARLKGQTQYSVIASINEKGMLIWEGIKEDLGFQIIGKNNWIKVLFSHTC